jgi:SNF2 family DNA or RNA helicase
MPIIVDTKNNGKTSAIGVRGYLDFIQGDELKAIGAAYMSKGRKIIPSAEDPEWRLNGHYEVPLPLMKRLFEDNGTTKAPEFMLGWEDSIDDLDADDVSDDAMLKRMRLKNFRTTDRAVALYKNYEQFENYLKLIKEGDVKTVNWILKAHDIDETFWSRPPLPHQRAGVAFFLLCISYGQNHICLFDEMRTGKTKQCIDIAKFLLANKMISVVLVVVPNTIKRIWLNEIRVDAPLHGSFSSIIEGTKMEKQFGWKSRQFFYIVNYEGARADKEELYKWQAYWKERGGYLLISDEAHKLKNPDSLQSRAVCGLDPDYSIYLTGTPVANRPEDCWTMTNATCPNLLGRTMEDFYYQFATRGGYTGKDIIGYQNLDEIKYRLTRISMRRLRKDIMFDQVMRQTRDGEMSGKQLKTYEEMRDTLMAELLNDDGEWTAVKAKSQLSKILRLQQITSGYLSNIAGDQVWFDENWKLRELDEFIEEYLDDIGKLVIWTRFVPPIHKLTERYEKYGSTCIYGAVKDEERANRMYNFQDNPNCRIMVAQILSASLGLGFQPATFAVFYDHWWSPSANKQAEDRIVGIKNPVPVTIINLVTKDAIDERIAFILQQKWDWARSITGDSNEDVVLPKMDKTTLLYLLAKPKEAEMYKTRIEKGGD